MYDIWSPVDPLYNKRSQKNTEPQSEFQGNNNAMDDL